MIVNIAVMTNMPICQTLSPNAASHGDVAGASMSVAMVGTKVTAPKMNAAAPARKVTTKTKPRIRNERHRVRRQLVTKARQTPAVVVPNSGRVKINRRFR